MEHTSLWIILFMSSSIYSGHTQSEGRRPSAVLSVSPAWWLNVGDSVTLSCEVGDSSTGWTFSWYRAVYDRQGSSIKQLPDSEGGAGGSYSVSPVGLNHTGLHVCRAERGDPVYYSYPSSHQLLWVAGLSPPASLTVSPNRSQFFSGENVSVSCEVQGNSTGWRVMSFTEGSWLSECLSVKSSTGPTCLLPSVSTSDSGMFWCESGSGEYSNAVNITVTAPTPPPAPVVFMSLPRLLCSLLVVFPYLLVTIVLVVKCCRAPAQPDEEKPSNDVIMMSDLDPQE